ncbi:MAG: pentapeptide repeat-containing protein [Nocardiaceae bacterium]|nr:pentapeptide repeat-containing protein [Nocardiaceae bacterium]
MPVRNSARGRVAATRIAPAVPKLPALRPAELPADAFEDEKHLDGLEYVGQDMAGSEVDSIEIELCRFDNVAMPAAMRRTTIYGTEFASCDFANVQADSGSLLQSTISSSRLTGMSWTGGTWRDVTVESARVNLTFFGYSKLQMVVFRDCELTQADFERVKFRNVLFEKCDLSGAQFSGAEMVNVRFVDCIMANLRGVADLRGSTVEGGDLLGLAAALAREAGISVEW